MMSVDHIFVLDIVNMNWILEIIHALYINIFISQMKKHDIEWGSELFNVKSSKCQISGRQRNR